MSGLNLADQTDVNDENGLEVDILIGGDQMYKFFTGREVREDKGKPGPIAYETRGPGTIPLDTVWGLRTMKMKG